MSIFSWSSLPGPQVLVSSAVRGGGPVIGPDQWNVAGDVRRHFYDRPTPIHTLIPTSIPIHSQLLQFLLLYEAPNCFDKGPHYNHPHFSSSESKQLGLWEFTMKGEF